MPTVNKMKSLIQEKLNEIFIPFVEEVRKSDNNKNRIHSLPGSAKSFLIKLLSQYEDKIVILFDDREQLLETNVELNILGVESQIILADEINLDSVQEIAASITSNQRFILLSNYDLLKAKFPTQIEYEKNSLKIIAGSELDYDELLEFLNFYNYDKENFVEIQGTFALRGAIIDFWSYSEKNPVRIEFNGDYIESIRYFDPESQRSIGFVDSIILSPKIMNGNEELAASIFDYLPNAVFYVEKIFLEKFGNEDLSIEKKIPETEEMDDELREDIFNGLSVQKDRINTIELKDQLDKNDILSQNVRWIIECPLSTSQTSFNPRLKNTPSFESNFNLLWDFIIRESQNGKTIIVTTENEFQKVRLEKLLTELSTELEKILEEGKLKFLVLPIKSGFEISQAKLVLLSDYKIFGKPYRKKISKKQKAKKSKTKDLASLKRGDFVVHETFGIGRYEGLEKIKIGSIEQESLKISYAEGDVVYVNLNYLGLVKKFSSREGVTPRVTKLGSSDWQKTKKKVKKRIKDAARDLIKLYAQRKASKGFSFSEDSVWQMELEASFYYEDTPDQTKVTDEIKKDMESQSPMDRLVCGDVGFGKTEIAIRAAFKAVNDGKQVAVLVPTTILAEQHFNTFRDRLASFPVKIETLSRFVPKRKQSQIIEELADGKVDIVIGTHRLLSKDISFKDLGLLIIDEEHRFGVMAKEKLRKLKVNVDTLTLTATPIPRTLNLSLLGARDLSIIATPPPNRQPVFTKVEVFDIVKIREWILKEKNRGGQIFFVHDRVETIEKLAKYLHRHIPEITYSVAHGKMKPAELEKVIFDFMNKKFDMLVSTKIIESGIDIPNVNTIIVNRADRFGLAELHQLRGRVGRSERKAFAYFLVPSLKTLNKKAIKRLQAIEEYSDLGEGFNLSMRDLEIRGAGNLLGEEQSGAIDSVGFDLYLKLLDEAIEELKHEEFADELKDLTKHIERADTVIDTYFEIGIPKNYMPNQTDRLSFYTSLFSIVHENEISEIIEEMEDRFGKIPQDTQLMIDVARLKLYASLLQFERVIINEKKFSIILPKASNQTFYDEKFTPLVSIMMNNYGKIFRLVQKQDSVKFEIKNNFYEPEKSLDFLIKMFKDLLDWLKS